MGDTLPSWVERLNRQRDSAAVEAMNFQIGPWPQALIEIVAVSKLRHGFSATVEDLDRGQGCSGLTLVIRVTCEDAYRDGRERSVVHYFPVPPAAYGRESWERWFFERYRDVDTHEAMETFVVDGEHPFAPDHGPGHDPYFVVQLTSDERRRTSFRGEVKPDA